MSVRTYNPSVLVGNWNEDIQLEEDTLKNFLEKREKGELLIQKTQNLTGSLGSQIELSVSQDFAIHIGDKVMLKCAAAKDQQKYSAGVDPRQGCVVALNITDPNALLQKNVQGPVVATGCRTVSPNQRTVFCVESVDGSGNGSQLRYGEPFYLTTVGDNTGKLYLCSDKVMFNKCAKKSRHQEVSLVPEPSFLTRWMVQHQNPLVRLEYEHQPVEANTELVIVHCKTNSCLAVEDKFNLRTPFGQEYELSVHTYLDSHKAEMDNNRWMLVVGVPGSSVNPVPNQGPGAAPLHPPAAS
ncbi:cilia- and flagella-associated protein 161-like [Babylonia areolata]|uniref:cilia- and flagella-associated protein 161-like n=1 Tax=Babylonia areolata TaxID=304850 RepID=UPI003FCFB8B3